MYPIREETYYSALGVSEAASKDETRAAYRNLIKQVHPDTLPQASAYWGKIAEEKAKELTEAYQVLSDTKQRATYDSLLDSHRQQRNTPPPGHQNPSGTATVHSKVGKHFYDWQSLRDWTRHHPFAATSLGLIIALSLFSLPLALNSPQISQPGPALAIGNNPTSASSYSDFPCDGRVYSVSPIDGKPCKAPASRTPQGIGTKRPIGRDAAAHAAPHIGNATPELPVTSSAAPKPGVLGISGADWEESGVKGVEVLRTEAGSAADMAGLHVGNVITDANGRAIHSTKDLADFLAQNGPGSKVSVGYMFKSTAMGWMPKETIVVLTK